MSEYFLESATFLNCRKSDYAMLTRQIWFLHLQQEHNNFRMSLTNSLSTLSRPLNSYCNLLREPRKSRIFLSKFRIPVTSSYIFTDLYDKLANRSSLGNGSRDGKMCALAVISSSRYPLSRNKNYEAKLMPLTSYTSNLICTVVAFPLKYRACKYLDRN